jgi:hypothetical protein
MIRRQRKAGGGNLIFVAIVLAAILALALRGAVFGFL